MTTLAIYGCGAIGSQVAMHLASNDISFILIDDDTVSVNNVNSRTSTYYYTQVGALKATCLAEMLWHKGKSRAKTYSETVTPANIQKFLENCTDCIAIDAFDNMESRSAFTQLYDIVPVLHAGVSLQRTGSVLWDRHFAIPTDNEGRYENPVCTNQLGAPILRLTSAVAVSALESYILHQEKHNYLITESLQVTRLVL